MAQAAHITNALGLIVRMTAASRATCDVPGRPRRVGTIHPVSQVMDELTAIFADMGFAVAEGPQVESDWFNFDALNIPPDRNTTPSS